MFCGVWPRLLWLNRQTSGWNCCSVLVWQYWHPSAPSHLLGSPHSSLCFTAGHGNALRRQKSTLRPEQKQQLNIYINSFKWRSRAPVFVLVWAAPPVFAVMEIWTGVTLTTKTRRFLTEFCLVVGQHIVVVWKEDGDNLFIHSHIICPLNNGYQNMMLLLPETGKRDIVLTSCVVTTTKNCEIISIDDRLKDELIKLLYM